MKMRQLLTLGLFLCALVMKGQTVTDVSTFAELQTALTSNPYIRITADITVTSRLTVPNGTTIDGNGHTISVPVPYLNEDGSLAESPSSFGVFNIASSSIVTLKNMKLLGGSGNAAVQNSGSLTMENVTMTRSNRGLQNSYVAVLNQCNLIRNAASYGGGLLNSGSNAQLVMDGCSFTENRSTSSSGGGGAAENNDRAKLYLNNTTMSNNLTTEIGSAINNYNSYTYVMNSTITGNAGISSSYNYGAIGINGGSTYVVNSIITDNKYIKNNGSGDVSESDVVRTSSTLINCVLGSGCVGTQTNCKTVTEDGSGVFASYNESGIYTEKLDGVTTGYSHAVLVKNGDQYTAPIAADGLAADGATKSYFNSYIDASGNLVITMCYNNGTEIVSLIPSGSTDVTGLTPNKSDNDPIGAGAVATAGTHYYTVSLGKVSNGNVTGVSLYGDSYVAGTSITVTAIPDEGRTFEGWTIQTGSTTTISTTNPYTFNISNNMTFTPKFSLATQDGTKTNAGKESNPWMIRTEADLEELANYVNNGTEQELYGTASTFYILDNDIAMTGSAFTPIGTSEHPFLGTFKGSNHTISNLKSTQGGLFGISNGTIENLKLSSVAVGNTSCTTIGAIVGINNGSISGCEVSSGTITGNSSGIVGAIVGNNTGTLTNNTYSSNVTVTRSYTYYQAQTYREGIGVGSDASGAYTHDIEGAKCSSSRYTITVDTPENGTISSVYMLYGYEDGSYKTNVSVMEKQVVAGADICVTATPSSGYTLVSLKYNNNEVNLASSPLKFTMPYDNTTIKATFTIPFRTVNEVNGDTPTAYDAEANPWAITSVEDLIMLGTLVKNGNSSYTSASYRVLNDINGVNNASGFAPIGNYSYPFKGTFDGNDKTITMDYTTSSYYAGLFGYIYGAKVSNVKVAGSIKGYQYVGGIVGYNTSTGKIISCVNLATIEGSGYHVGGIVGYNYTNAEVMDCTNKGDVTGRYYVGGIAGYNSSTGKIKNCRVEKQSTPITIAATYTSSYYGYAGAIIGYNYATVSVSDGTYIDGNTYDPYNVTVCLGKSGDTYVHTYNGTQERAIGRAYGTNPIDYTDRAYALVPCYCGSTSTENPEGKGLIWTLTGTGSDKILTISVNPDYASEDSYSKEMKYYTPSSTYYSTAPWKDEVSNIKSIVIGEGVLSVGYGAFYGCNAATSATIPNTVTHICGDAFKLCSALTSITIPSSVTQIDTEAFYNCPGLATIIFDGCQLTSVGLRAFLYCPSIATVTVNTCNPFANVTQTEIFSSITDGTLTVEGGVTMDDLAVGSADEDSYTYTIWKGGRFNKTFFRDFAFTASDWRTWYGGEDLTANTSELDTYIVTDVTDNSVTLRETNGEIYQNMPMLLKRKDNTAASIRGLAPASALTSPTDASPYYIGGVSDLSGYSNVYVLAGAEFVKADLSGTDLSFNPEKCFLALDGVTASARLAIYGNATGVDSVPAVQPLTGDDLWYGLSGQKLDGKPTKKGLYIHNGRKDLVK